MLTIKFLLLAVSLFIQGLVLAAPIPLNARELALNDDALFSRGRKGNGKKSTFAWIISWHFDPILEYL